MMREIRIPRRRQSFYQCDADDTARVKKKYKYIYIMRKTEIVKTKTHS